MISGVTLSICPPHALKSFDRAHFRDICRCVVILILHWLFCGGQIDQGVFCLFGKSGCVLRAVFDQIRPNLM